MKLLSLLAVAVLVVSCSSAPRPISIGINSWPGFEFLYLAKVKGLFEERGLNVRIVEYSSLEDARYAYERSQLDGLACTLVEHAQIIDNSERRPVICAVTDYSDGGDIVLAHPSHSSLDSIRGARIGLEVKSLGIFVLARLLQKAGLEMEEVELVPSDQLSLPDKFCQGEIDIAISHQPYVDEIQDACEARAIFTSAEIPGEILDVIVFENELVQDRGGEIESILAVYFDAQQWAMRNQKEAFAIMAEREGISSEQFAEILHNDIKLISRSEQAEFMKKGGPLENAMANGQDALFELGQISNANRNFELIKRP